MLVRQRVNDFRGTLDYPWAYLKHIQRISFRHTHWQRASPVMNWQRAKLRIKRKKGIVSYQDNGLQWASTKLIRSDKRARLLANLSPGPRIPSENMPHSREKTSTGPCWFFHPATLSHGVHPTIQPDSEGHIDNQRAQIHHISRVGLARAHPLICRTTGQRRIAINRVIA